MQPSFVHCLVARKDQDFVFTASADGVTYVTATFSADPDHAAKVLHEQVRPALNALKAKGSSIGIQTTEEAEQVWFAIGAILGDVLDGIGSAVRVTLPKTPPEAAELDDATEEPEAPAPVATASVPTPVAPVAPQAPVSAPSPAPPPAPAASVAAQAPKPSRARVPHSQMTPSELLAAITRYSRWGEAANARDCINRYLAQEGDSPTTRAKVNAAETRGRKQHKLEADFKRALARGDSQSAKEIEAQLIKLIGPKYGPGHVAALRSSEEAYLKKQKEIAKERQAQLAASTIKPSSYTHNLRQLPAAPRWELIIDETDFTDGVPLNGVVGILVPQGAPLPPPPAGFHAVNFLPSQRDEVMQTLLNAPVGILGLNVRSHQKKGDAWLSGIIELVEWTVRLMTIEGPTALRVCVEERGGHVAGDDWQPAFSHMLLQLRRRDPARYDPLEITVDVLKKDQHPLNGYPDVVAHTWGSHSSDCKARLKGSELIKNGCLHASDAPALRAAWDLVKAGDGPSGPEWRMLMQSPDAYGKDNERTLLRELLDGLAAHCRGNKALWRRYLDEVLVHQQSKAVNLRALGREVKWLASCGDVDSLPPVLELGWRTAQMEMGNHEGAVDTSLEDRLEQLSVRLVDEEPALVCQSDLNRTVRQTNAFAFDAAEARLARWQDARPREPGLRHWGRLLSQRGQLEAFRGRNAAAIALFTQALDAFERLSDPRDRKGEQGQTATYLAIATLDSPDAPPDEVRRRVEAVVSLAPGEITRMAGETNPATKFAHHLLLRYLVSRGTAEEKAAYLSARNDWEMDFGHPWQLILAYRGALLWPTDAAAGERLMNRAVALCQEEDDTVKRIGGVLEEEAKAWRAGARTLDRMKTGLPFNFR